MKVEFSKNNWDNDYWFDLGVSLDTTKYNEYKYVFTIGLGFWTLYIRFKRK